LWPSAANRDLQIYSVFVSTKDAISQTLIQTRLSDLILLQRSATCKIFSVFVHATEAINYALKHTRCLFFLSPSSSVIIVRASFLEEYSCSPTAAVAIAVELIIRVDRGTKLAPRLTK
jgi:hypothetical protein